MRHIGVSNFDVEQLRRIQQIAPVETLQPPYSLIAREVEEEILPFAEREGIGVIVYSPMGSGLLTGAMTRERIERLPDDDWRKRDAALPASRSSRENLALVDGSRRSPSATAPRPGAVAVAWTLRTRPWTARSSASAGPTRSTRSPPLRTSTRRGGRRGDRGVSVRARPRAAAAG